MKKLLSVAALLAVGQVRAETVIKIATCSPLSGAQAALGEMIKLGAQVAVEEAQAEFAAKGVKLELTPQDDQASPDVGVAVAKRLVNDPAVLGIVGHFNSGVAIPSSEVYKDYDLAMVSPANTNPRVTERRYANVNRVCGRDDVQGPVGASFAINDLGAKKLFVIHDKTAYGQGVADAFRTYAQKNGAKVVAFLGTEEKSNFQSLILQMRALQPDFVYLGGIYDQGGVLVKQMRERGIKATFMGPDGFDSSEYVKIGQDSVVGSHYTSVAGPIDQYPAAKAFADTFKERFGKTPESFALYAYDSARVIIEALKATIGDGGAAPTRKAVSEAVRKVSLEGITGKISFDDKGDRSVSDYFVLRYDEAKYPAKVVKVISQSAP